MKNIFNSITIFIIYIINLFFKYKTKKFFSHIRIKFYSLWIAKQFPQIGTRVYFLNKITLHGIPYIHIQKETVFGYGCIITAWDNYREQKFSPSINIGMNCNFGEYNHITSINSITIGNGVLTGRWVTITDNSHGESCYKDLCTPPLSRKLYSKGPVIIEDNVWIGDKVTILPNVKIGKSSIIAANSVVTKDVPPYSVVAGIPATIVKSIKSN